MRGPIRALGTCLLLLLAGCAGERPGPAVAVPQVVLPSPAAPLVGPVQCVPYARQQSGIALRGDAWTWWEQAGGRYARGKAPRAGAVLVFARTRKLLHGHLSVVTRVVHARELLVTHANWSSSAATLGRVTHDVRVIDISPANDWSELRVWNGSGFGMVYPAKGFIYPIPIGV
jgi:surface antigen